MKDKILQILSELKFKGMAEALDRELEKSEKQGLGAGEVILNLLLEESRSRQERSLKYRLDQACLPYNWTLSTFPFEKQPGVDKKQIMNLSGLDFISRGENIVLIGKTGVGKTGVAMGLLRQAIMAGYRCRYYNAQDLMDELYASLADRSTPRVLKSLCRFDLIQIDELGYLTLKSEQMNAFFKLMAERYQTNKSTIITTNLELEEWYDLFEPKDMVDALLDRLKHRCITIRIKGQSLRKSK